ncbi:hypothetical protein [Vibrio sp. HN007]|uniref:hypothetical protein n=1 Tax=Vibrio iocasae TaxID=3098914 RepID=UPI0035D3E3A1
MAGLLIKITEEQKPKVSSYVDQLLQKAIDEFGVNSSAYKGIYNQYFKMPVQEKTGLVNRRHYEAEMVGDDLPKGLERLYKRVTVIDLLSTCASECVYCLRGYYQKFALSDEDIQKIAVFCGKDPHLKEVLITGGDPFISPRKLKYLITELADHAPNIQFVRIGTRLPVQAPNKFDESLYEFFEGLKDRFTFEVACQINHPFELQPMTRDILTRLQKSGCRIYSQNVLLKDVNNNIDTLVELYDELRYLGITPHYFFHAVPMKGTDNFRTTVLEGLELIKQLTAMGHLSGRAKPQYALMTDIGKVTLYHDSIIGREGPHLIIKTAFTLEERLKWNPYYQLPDSAIVNDDGTLSVRYLDGQQGQ